MGCTGYVVGGLRRLCGSFMKIMPRCGSILQARTCQILSLTENPRWSRVWQFGIVKNLDKIQSMSKYSFKKLVMKKAREFEFDRFLNIKASKSKMSNLSYTCLEIQDYLLLKSIKIFPGKDFV